MESAGVSRRESESRKVRENRQGLEHTQTHHCLSPAPLRRITGFVDSDLPRGQITLR